MNELINLGKQHGLASFAAPLTWNQCRQPRIREIARKLIINQRDTAANLFGGDRDLHPAPVRYFGKSPNYRDALARCLPVTLADFREVKAAAHGACTGEWWHARAAMFFELKGVSNRIATGGKSKHFSLSSKGLPMLVSLIMRKQTARSPPACVLM